MTSQTTATPPANPTGTTARAVFCGECGEDYPTACPDMCGTLFGHLEQSPARRRPFRVRPLVRAA